jgi:hypothetical protein
MNTNVFEANSYCTDELQLAIGKRTSIIGAIESKKFTP